MSQPEKSSLSDNARQIFWKLHEIIMRSEPKSESLLGGRLGLALYFYCLYHAFHDESYKKSAINLLEEVYANLNGEDVQLAGNSLAGGGAGLGFLVALFHRDGFIHINMEDDLADLDEFLYNTSLQQIMNDDQIDYLHGATGVIHYFTQRMPGEKITGYLMNLVTAFCNRAVKEENGVWFRNWITNRDNTREINLSLSHGLCGWLLILINVYNAGLPLPRIQEIVGGGIDFILSFQQDIEMEKKNWSFFPSTINAANKADYFRSQRLAWCYGDLGQVLLFYRAAEILNRPELIEKANLIGTFTLLRKDADATVITETLFCHGSAGVARFYQTLYQLSGIARYREGEEYWIKQTLDMLPAELEQAIYHGKEYELLEGLAGVNLALLSFFSKKELNWGKVFLL